MRGVGSFFGSQIAQTLVTIVAAIACGVLAGLWISRIGSGSPYPIAPRVDSGTVAAADPLDGIEGTATLFGSRRPGGPARNIQALGLIADTNGQGGAIVAVEGQPPRAVRVGDRIEGRLVTAIDAHGVTLEGSATRDTVPLLQRTRAAVSGLNANNASPVGPAVAPASPSGPSLLGQAPDNGAVPDSPPGYSQPPPPSLTGR
jgi:general secretion pathway protein C